MKINVLIFCTVVLCSSCSNKKEETASKLVGKWYLELNTNDTIEFTAEGLYYDSKYNNKSEEFKGKVQNLDGSIADVDYGRLRYREISYSDNILIVSIYGEKNDLEFRRKGYVLDDGQNSLIEIVYKMGESIRDHIQFAQRYYHIERPPVHNNLNDSIVLFIPTDFEENNILVAFDQDVKEDTMNVIHVGPSNVVKVAFKEDMKIFLNGGVFAYVVDSTGKKKQLFTLQSNQWNKLLRGDIDISRLPVPLDSVIVIASSRFNPSRRFVNEQFGESIEGNVATFNYTTLRKELGYRGLLHSEN